MAASAQTERTLKTHLAVSDDLNLEAAIEYIIVLLKRRQLKSSTDCALATLHILRRTIDEYKWSNDQQGLQKLVDQLLARVQQIGQRLILSRPKELIINNMMARVVRTVKESARTYSSNVDDEVSTAMRPPPSMFQLFSPEKAAAPPKALTEPLNKESKFAFKAEILGAIEEDIDEVKQANDQISTHATEHLGSNEVILTASSSRTVQRFLLKAADGKKLSVFFVEPYPINREEELSTMSFVQPLTAAGVTVVIIPDVSVWAVMSRMDKVILTAHLVLGNGGMIATSGTQVVAKVAKRFQKPVIVLAGSHQFCRDHPYNPQALITYGNPANGISFKDVEFAEEAEVHNPLNDYIVPELVDIYITNTGAHAPSTGLLEQQA